MQEGYIKLHRCVLDHGWSRHPEYMAVWVYCLLRGNYKASDVVTKWGGVVHLEPGQFITSREQISVNTGVQESKVERILKLFKSEQQIEQQNRGKFRIISILNWHKYQASEQENEQQVNNRRTTREQHVNTDKKEEEGKEKTKGAFTLPAWIPHDAWEGWLDMRAKAKKPPTTRAMQLAVKKLEQLAESGHDPGEVLDQSTTKGWTDLYEIKARDAPKQAPVRKNNNAEAARIIEERRRYYEDNKREED